MQTFQRLEKNHLNINQNIKTKLPITASINKIISNNPITNDDLRNAIKMITNSNMIQAIWTMFRIYISGLNPKKHAVWVHGKANSGKTYLADQLSKIFMTEQFTDSESRYVASRSRSKYETQLVNIDEANFIQLFKPCNISRMKKFTEGRGWYSEVKY